MGKTYKQEKDWGDKPRPSKQKRARRRRDEDISRKSKRRNNRNGVKTHNWGKNQIDIVEEPYGEEYYNDFERLSR